MTDSHPMTNPKTAMPEIDVIPNENEAIFYNDWVACLCAHYLYCQQQGDAANALGLRRVLLEAGVSDAYIDSLVLPMPPSAEPEAAIITESTEVADAVPMAEAEALPAAPDLTELEPVNTVIDIPLERPLDQPSALDLISTDPTIETVEIAPAAPQALSLEPGPDLTPDYPSSGKPKRGKRTPPPQPTLF